MSEQLSAFFDMDIVYSFLHAEGAAYLFTLFIILWAAKFIFDYFTPYKINEQLVIEDNKAVALSFAGYMLGVSIVVWGVFSTETTITTTQDFYLDLLSTVVWGIIGILLLQVARIVNDKYLLGSFDNVKELVTDKNIGTGAVEFGSYVGSALIIHACLLGEDESFLHGIISTIVFFAMGQVGFIVFGRIYQLVSRYDLYAEIEKDNVSAGVAFGLNLIAIAILLSGYIQLYDSLPGYIAWLLISMILLVVIRYLVDKILLPGALLDEEVSQDQNWGAVLVEGSIAIGLALILVPTFLG